MPDCHPPRATALILALWIGAALLSPPAGAADDAGEVTLRAEEAARRAEVAAARAEAAAERTERAALRLERLIEEFLARETERRAR